MDEVTQRTAFDKVKSVKEYIGYCNELLDNRKLKQLYKKVILN